MVEDIESIGVLGVGITITADEEDRVIVGGRQLLDTVDKAGYVCYILSILAMCRQVDCKVNGGFTAGVLEDDWQERAGFSRVYSNIRVKTSSPEPKSSTKGP